jgi:hypothetical protein
MCLQTDALALTRSDRHKNMYVAYRVAVALQVIHLPSSHHHFPPPHTTSLQAIVWQRCHIWPLACACRHKRLQLFRGIVLGLEGWRRVCVGKRSGVAMAPLVQCGTAKQNKLTGGMVSASATSSFSITYSKKAVQQSWMVGRCNSTAPLWPPAPAVATHSATAYLQEHALSISLSATFTQQHPLG